MLSDILRFVLPLITILIERSHNQVSFNNDAYLSKNNVLVAKVNEYYFGCTLQDYVISFKSTVDLTHLNYLNVCGKTITQFKELIADFLKAFPDAEQYLYNSKWTNIKEHCNVWTILDNNIHFNMVEKCNCFTVEGESGTLSYVNDCSKCM